MVQLGLRHKQLVRLGQTHVDPCRATLRQGRCRQHRSLVCCSICARWKIDIRCAHPAHLCARAVDLSYLTLLPSTCTSWTKAMLQVWSQAASSRAASGLGDQHWLPGRPDCQQLQTVVRGSGGARVQPGGAVVLARSFVTSPVSCWCVLLAHHGHCSRSTDQRPAWGCANAATALSIFSAADGGSV